MATEKYIRGNRIYESTGTRIYKARRKRDQLPVIIKALRSEYPADEFLSALHHEYAILRQLNHEGIIRAHALEKRSNGPALILEDFGGESLEALLHTSRFATRSLNLSRFLSFAIRIAGILADLHGSGIIHNHITLANMVVNPDTEQLKLIDFGEATKVADAGSTEAFPAIAALTPAYISPEQTGKTNYVPDHRTDFYSLGVSFFQLFSGRLPFQASDSSQFIHAHLTEPVPVLHEINPAIPVTLSSIVAKLMAKTPGERYQNAASLKTDLQRCLDQLTLTGKIEPFQIDAASLVDRPQSPYKLYGRERQFQQLSEILYAAQPRGPDLILVSGPAGIGKTTFVQAFQDVVEKRQGYFIAGKFDQYLKAQPYTGWIQAMDMLVERWITENDRQLLDRKDRILNAVGASGRLLTEVIPNLEAVIGPQPHVVDVAPIEAQNRFVRLFIRFINAVAQPGHPIVGVPG